MPGPEGKIERIVVDYAKAHNIMVTKLNLLSYRSMPDRCLWIPGGKPLLIEFKRPGGLPTELQAHTINRMLNLGYDVHVVDDEREGVTLLDRTITRLMKQGLLK